MTQSYATPAAPASNTVARMNADQSSQVDTRVRAAFGAEQRIGAANEARAAQASANAAAARPQIPDVTQSLSTIAIAGALSSVPLALSLMQQIALAVGSGTLSDADLKQLQAEYAQLTQKVSSVVGSASAGAQAESSAGHDSRKDDNAESSFRENSDDRRSTLTRTVATSTQTVQRDPVAQLVPTTRTTLVEDGHAPASAPVTTLRTHELHVGTDSYEPAPLRQTQTRFTTPAARGRLEQRTETHRVLVAQVAQIRQLSEVGQTAHIAPLSAVA